MTGTVPQVISVAALWTMPRGTTCGTANSRFRTAADGLRGSFHFYGSGTGRGSSALFGLPCSAKRRLALKRRTSERRAAPQPALSSRAFGVRPRSVSSAVRDGVLNEQMPCQLRRISVATHGFGPYPRPSDQHPGSAGPLRPLPPDAPSAALAVGAGLVPAVPGHPGTTPTGLTRPPADRPNRN